jgi:hypothetical protein
MKKVIIVFEDDYNDCDIISVPDFVADQSEKFCQMFFRWLDSEDLSDEYYVFINGEKCIGAETIGLVNWLNEYICPSNEQASIIEQHIKFEYGYPIMEF